MLEPFIGDPLCDTQVSVSRVGAASVVRLSCPSVQDVQAELLGRHIADLASRVGGKVVIEVSGIAKFTCAWINALIDLTSKCSHLGGKLMLVGFNADAEKLLRDTRLDQRLNLARTEHAALEAIGCPVVSSWRLAIARALSIPVARPEVAKAA